MSFSEKAKQIISSVAPLIGTAIGGPFGALAGTIVHQALGTGGDEKALETAVMSGNPDALLKLKTADQDFQLRMAELGISEDKLRYDDTANARAREIALSDNTPAILAYAVTVGFFGTLGFMLVNGKPATGGDALLVMLGSLGTAWAAIVAYYFGSSAGSKRKDEALSHIAKMP